MGWKKMLGSQAEPGAFCFRHWGYLPIAIFNVKNKRNPLIPCDFAQSTDKMLTIS
jgi:hypothetical protein